MIRGVLIMFLVFPFGFIFTVPLMIGLMILIDRRVKKVYGVRLKANKDRGFEVIEKDGR